MDSERSLALVYALAVAAYVLLMARGYMAGRSGAWKFRAAGAWVLIFGGLFVLVSCTGWRLP